jgi:hypothetical protein
MRCIDPILHVFAGLKMNSYFCRQLNRCTGLGISGNTGRPVM